MISPGRASGFPSTPFKCQAIKRLRAEHPSTEKRGATTILRQGMASLVRLATAFGCARDVPNAAIAQKGMVMDKQLLTLASAAKKALERTRRNRKDWLASTFVLAKALSRARKELRADQEFSKWLVK